MLTQENECIYELYIGALCWCDNTNCSSGPPKVPIAVARRTIQVVAMMGHVHPGTRQIVAVMACSGTGTKRTMTMTGCRCTESA